MSSALQLAATALAVIVGGLALLVSVVSYRYYAFRKKLPPGPVGIPFLGNMLEAPKKYPWRTFTELHKKYGPVFSMQFGLNTVIFLGTHEVARELLEKRSNIYSSRPAFTMVGECVSQGNRSLILPYGDKWRAYHRLQGSFLSPRMSQTYREIQDLESKQLVLEFLTRKDHFRRFHRYSSSLSFALGYGKRMPTGNEPEVTGVDKIMADLNDVFIQNWIVDTFPFLNNLPTFLAPWKKYAKVVGDEERHFFSQIRDVGNAQEGYNWCKDVLTMRDSKTLTDLELSYVIGNTYEAGSDTTTMTLQVFMMCAVLFPDKMDICRAEIDAVVGRDRLPNWDDLEKMPYLAALVKEVHRWRPVLPGGVPHAVTEEDEYMGYRIPKGATVIGGHWAISMDANMYPNPDDFEPQRFIENPDLPFSQFGFGRRKCIGQYIGNNSMLINVARFLWAYEIGHEYEEVDGKQVKCEVDPLAFVSSFNSPPLPFKAKFTPRQPNVPDILQREFDAAEKDEVKMLKRIEVAQIRMKEGENAKIPVV